ncbi:phosphatidylinositol transfer protein csr1 [Lecanicillium sp. MT-2017a]|nr:phosphatidylinositol transfer protein csr1 [Lecanicillium sp. MT-2017a]
MASTEVPSGHLGNLSPEQEEKLRQFWQAIGNVCGWSETGSAPTKETTKEASNVTAAADSGKWGFSLFRKTEDTSAASASGNSAEDDKFGLTKQFDDVLAKQSAESIRQTIWSMVKHDHPDALALRFLRARKWDVQKALVMFIAAMNWRDSEMHVDDDIMKQGEAGAAESERGGDTNNMKIGHDFMEQIRMGKSFLHGNDREGRPICVVRVRLHRNGDQCAESIERYTVHIIETARLLLAPPVETATIVFDMTSFTLANMDYAPVKFMIKCFEANYPESLGAVLIHNAPWVFQGIWRIIRGWLDPVVASKVHFTNGRSGLEQFIEPSKIISELGGDEQWEYKYEEPVDGENKSMEDAASKAMIMEERAGLVKEFEEATKTWIRDSEGNSGKQAAETRTEVARKMRANYWKLDPYVRAKSLYDRQGVIKVGGSIDYYPENAQ